jgi:catechol 2,3-dioxygenase-like lactoylglutathione lyase family enzyme
VSLTHNRPISFIATLDADASRHFYENILGLTFVGDDHYALVFKVGPEHGCMLRIVRMQQFTPVQFTVFGWEVDDIHATISELQSKGVEFLRFGFFQQDEFGVWLAPDGSQVAWFQDPDGNTLSISHHQAAT